MLRRLAATTLHRLERLASPVLVTILSLLGSRTARVLSSLRLTMKTRAPDLDVTLSAFRNSGVLFSRRSNIQLEQLNGLSRASDTLAIIGSGASLNELTDPEKTLINRCDCFSLNASFLCPFPIRFQLLQLPIQRILDDTDSRESLGYFNVEMEAFQRAVTLESDRFRNTVVLARTTSTWFQRVGRNERMAFLARLGCPYIELPFVSFAPPYSSPIDRILHENSWLADPWSSSLYPHVLKFGSSLPMAILIGVRLGYTKILLAGFDLLDRRHFYDTPEFNTRFNEDGRLSSLINLDGGFALDNLVDKTSRGTTQIEDVAILVNWLESTGRCDVRIINTNSRLYGPLRLTDNS